MDCICIKLRTGEVLERSPTTRYECTVGLCEIWPKKRKGFAEATRTQNQQSVYVRECHCRLHHHYER